MNDDPLPSIPLLSFSAPLTARPWEEKDDAVSFPMFRVAGGKYAKGCYGVKIEDESMAPILCSGMIAVFSVSGSRESAQEGIFSIGRKGELPLIRKVVKNEAHSDGSVASNAQKGRLRKSFMTPTPLHIPGSRVSPIAESTHRMIYFKSLADPEELILFPAGNVLWMHPLVMALPEEKIKK